MRQSEQRKNLIEPIVWENLIRFREIVQTISNIPKCIITDGGGKNWQFALLRTFSGWISAISELLRVPTSPTSGHRHSPLSFLIVYGNSPPETLWFFFSASITYLVPNKWQVAVMHISSIFFNIKSAGISSYVHDGKNFELLKMSMLFSQRERSLKILPQNGKWTPLVDTSDSYDISTQILRNFSQPEVNLEWLSKIYVNNSFFAWSKYTFFFKSNTENFVNIFKIVPS